MPGIKLRRGSDVISLPDRLATPERLKELTDAGWTAANDELIVESEQGRRLTSGEEAVGEAISGTAQLARTEGLTPERARFLASEAEGLAGGALGAVQAFGEGGVSALTFGLADPLLEGLEENISGDSGLVAKRAEVNPYASLAGQVTAAAVGGIGGLAKSGSAKILSAGPGAIARIGARAGKAAGGGVKGAVAGGAAEGMLFGGAQSVSNNLLHDKPFSAEAVLAEAGSGALFGGAVGGAVGLAGAGFAKLASKIDDVALKSANPVLREGSEAQARIARTIADDVKRYSNVRAQAGDALSPELLKASQIANVADQRVAAKMFNKAGEPDFKKLSKLTADDWLGPEVNGQRTGGLLDDILETESTTKKIAATIGDESLETGLAAKLEEIAAQENASVGAGGVELASLLEATDMSPVDVSSIVEKVTGSEKAAALVNLFAAAKVAGRIGKNEPTKFWKGLSGGKIANLGRNPAGALGQLVGGMGSAVGRTKELITSGVGKFVKVGAAAAKSKAAVPSAVAVLGNLRFDPNVGEKPDKNPFKARAAELDRALADPAKTAEAIRKKLAPVNHIDPEVGELAAQGALARLQFYGSKAPRNPLESQGLYRVGRWEPPASEVARFARYVRAGEQPLTLLDDMANGRVTPEAVEAVKTLYPEIYSRIQLELVTQLAEPGAVEALSYGQRVQMKIFFDVPTDPTLTDEFYATMQDLYVMRDEQAQQGNQNYSTPGAVSEAPGLTEQPTAAQRIEM